MPVPIPRPCWENILRLNLVITQIADIASLDQTWPIKHLEALENVIINFHDIKHTNYSGCDEDLLAYVEDDIKSIVDRVQKVLHRDRKIIADEVVNDEVYSKFTGLIIHNGNVINTPTSIFGEMQRITETVFDGYATLLAYEDDAYDPEIPGYDAQWVPRPPARKLRVINR